MPASQATLPEYTGVHLVSGVTPIPRHAALLVAFYQTRATNATRERQARGAVKAQQVKS